MENPPKEIRKIAYNVTGLSFKKGEYGVMRVRAGINDKIELRKVRNYGFGLTSGDSNKKEKYTLFSNMVDDAPNLLSLLKRMEALDVVNIYELVNGTSEVTDLKACVFSFENANVIVKETGGRLVMVAI
jgi:hypothetical protein